MSGHSFQFTPGGIVALGQAVSTEDETVIPANADLFRAPEAQVQHVPKVTKNVAFGKQKKPANIVKLARCRLREVERELKRLRSLEQERDELRRLLDAATNKPRAVVRDISAAKRG